MNTYDPFSDPSLQAELIQSLAISGAICLVLYFYTAITLYIIARKTQTDHAWLAWFPPFSLILLVFIARRPGWWVILLLIPLVNLIVLLMLWYHIAEARHKPGWTGLLIIVPVINLVVPLYLALGPGTGAPGMAAAVPEETTTDTCPSCGAPRSGNATICGECGKAYPKEPPPVCAACSTPGNTGDIYCGNCGTRLGAAAKAIAPASGSGAGAVMAVLTIFIILGIAAIVALRTRFWERTPAAEPVATQREAPSPATAPAPAPTAEQELREYLDSQPTVHMEPSTEEVPTKKSDNAPTIVTLAPPADTSPAPEPKPETEPKPQPPPQPPTKVPEPTPPVPEIKAPHRLTAAEITDLPKPSPRTMLQSQAVHARGMRAWRSENYELAAREFQQAIGMYPQQADYHASLAGAKWRLKQTDDARFHAGIAKALGLEDHWGLRAMEKPPGPLPP